MEQGRSSMSIRVAVLGLVLVLCCAKALVAGATEWTVGDGKGWTFGAAGWENGKAFSAGDVLVFKYDPNIHNVVQVNEGDYNWCAAGSGARTYTSGNDKITLAGGKTFFICTFRYHCQQGMRIAVATK